MEIRITDADNFDRQAQGADMAVVLISRQDIEAFLVGSTVERLMLLSDCAKHVHRFAGRMVIQIDGYDTDPRPIATIPECVRFLRAVNEQWNYWFHFLVPDPDQLKLIMLTLIDVEVQASDGEFVGYALRDPWQFGVVLGRLFTAMNDLHDVFAVPTSHAEAMTNAVLAALDCPGGNPTQA